MDKDNCRVTRSLSRFANISEPVLKKEEVNIPRMEEKLKIKKDDLEGSLMKEQIELLDDDESLYGTEEEKLKARYSQRDIPIDHLPVYRGGDLAKFFKEWTYAITLHGERLPREKLFYLPLAFEPNV